MPTQLEVTPCSLDQLDPTSNKVIASYDYKDIVATIGIQDYEQGIVIAYGKFTRLHLFRAANHHEIVQNLVHAANQYMNIALKVVPSQITLSKFEHEKFGLYSYVTQADASQLQWFNSNNCFPLAERTIS